MGVTKAIPTYDEFVVKGLPFTISRPDQPQIAATFKYDEHRWYLYNLLRQNERPHDGTIRFNELPDWLRGDAKRYVAHVWLLSVTYPKSIHNIMTIFRHVGRILPNFKGWPIELGPKEATKLQEEFLRQKLSTDSNVRFQKVMNAFYDFICSQYPIPIKKSFRIQFPSALTKKIKKNPLEVPPDEIVSEEILAQIIDACINEVKAYYQAKEDYIDQHVDRLAYLRQWKQRRQLRREQGLPENLSSHINLQHLHLRAIKSQAIILAICTGRRSAAYWNLPMELKMSRVQHKNAAGTLEHGVIIRFQEMKTSYVYENVYCPEEFGDLVWHAIETIRDLTKVLRQKNPDVQEFLFIRPSYTYEHGTARVMAPKEITSYLNGSMEDGRGLLARYNIPCPKITLTMLRKTRATALYTGELSVSEIAADLGHAYADMSLGHYISGKEITEKRLKKRMEQDGLRNKFSDFCGGADALF